MSAALSVLPVLPVHPATAPLVRRLIAVLLVVLSSLAVLASPATADVRPYRLTHAQERVVLKLIDDVCGDTWCEGDHAFRFRRFSCHPRRTSCLLVLQIAPWSEEPLRWQRRAHRIVGFHRFGDMVVTAPGGERSLRPAFYEAVGAAVRAVEAAATERSASLVTSSWPRAAGLYRW